MNVSRTPELERFIAEQVQSGRCCSASEVVRDALRLLHDQLLDRAGKLEALKAAVETGLAELDRGEGVPAEDVFTDLIDGLGGPEAA